MLRTVNFTKIILRSSCYREKTGPHHISLDQKFSDYLSPREIGMMYNLCKFSKYILKYTIDVVKFIDRTFKCKILLKSWWLFSICWKILPARQTSGIAVWADSTQILPAGVHWPVLNAKTAWIHKSQGIFSDSIIRLSWFTIASRYTDTQLSRHVSWDQKLSWHESPHIF